MSDDSPRTDLCNLSNGDITISSFDTNTGEYSFLSTDPEGFPFGVYTFEITSELITDPTEITVSTFEITLKEPCSLDLLLRSGGGLTITNPFED